MSECMIPANVASIVLCVSNKNQSLFAAMTGVQVGISESAYKLAATDGSILAIITGPDSGGFRDFGELRIGDPKEQAVLPAKDFAEIFGARPKPILVFDGMSDEEEVVHPDLRKAFVALGSTGSVLASKDGKKIQKRKVKNVEGRFPNVNAVLPKDKPIATAEIDPVLLIQLLQIAAGLHTEFCHVTLEIHKEKVVLRTKNTDRQEFTGVLVQLVKLPKEK